MSYVKQNFVDGQTLTAAQLNHMEDGIAAAAADADYFDYRRACGRLYYVVNQFHKNAPLRPALRRI